MLIAFLNWMNAIFNGFLILMSDMKDTLRQHFCLRFKKSGLSFLELVQSHVSLEVLWRCVKPLVWLSLNKIKWESTLSSILHLYRRLQQSLISLWSWKQRDTIKERVLLLTHFIIFRSVQILFSSTFINRVYWIELWEWYLSLSLASWCWRSHNCLFTFNNIDVRRAISWCRWCNYLHIFVFLLIGWL